MAYRQYTECYAHTPGDEPFNESNLPGFVLGAAGAGGIASLILFAGGSFGLGAVIFGITYAAAIAAVADEWLYHRLACVRGGGPRCAVGVVENEPEDSDFGTFDNDQHFDVRLMPHRAGDAYSAANSAWPGGIGPTADGETALVPENDIYLDGFQGQDLLAPDDGLSDLSYDGVTSALHCEAEGNFWAAMKETAVLQGLAVAVGSGLGAAAGASLGCAIGGFLGFIGCIIGAIIGAILGALLGGAAAAYVGAQIAFHSDPGDVEDAHVGDTDPTPIAVGDRVAVFGKHVYDGFHTGWHEFHPLMAVVRIPSADTNAYLEWNPDFIDGDPLPSDPPDAPPEVLGLGADDMRRGLASPLFRRRAEWLKRRWCGALQEAFAGTTRALQATPIHRWTIHPDIDGCDR